jgi:hypothetical protein
MAKTTIPTGGLADSAVTSAKITDATIATADIANDAVTKDKITGINTPAFKAVRSSAQAIGDETSTVVLFDSEIYDTDSAYATGTGIFTVPAGKGGKYAFFVTGGFNSSQDIDVVNFWLSKNDQTAISATAGLAMGIDVHHNGTDASNQSQQVSGCFNLAATDTVRVYAWQNYGGNRNLAQGGRMTFSGFRVADE